MRKSRHVADLTPEEHELRKAKRSEWYRTRSPEYKAELLRKQREYNARKKAEAAEKGEKVRRAYNVTKEQQALHSMQNAISKQRRIEARQKEIEEQGLTGMRVCTVCTKARPIKDFLSSYGNGKLCKVCCECRARIYAPGAKGERVFGPSFWKRKANIQNSRLLARARKEAPETTIFDLSDTVDAADLAKLYEEQGHKCCYCGAELSEALQVDHKIPRSRGGCNTIDNICLACSDCNRLKWTMTADEFIEFLYSYAQRVISRIADKEPQVIDNQQVTHSSKGPWRSEPSSPDGTLSTMATEIDSSISCISIKENVHTKEGELPEYPTGGAEDNRKPSSDQMEFDF